MSLSLGDFKPKLFQLVCTPDLSSLPQALFPEVPLHPPMLWVQSSQFGNRTARCSRFLAFRTPLFASKIVGFGDGLENSSSTETLAAWGESASLQPDVSNLFSKERCKQKKRKRCFYSSLCWYPILNAIIFIFISQKLLQLVSDFNVQVGKKNLWQQKQ